MKLDKKDKQILELVAKNSRINNSQIAKALQLSKDTIKYRLNNLEKNNIISQQLLYVDARKLGLTRYHLLIRLNTTSLEREKIIKEMSKHPHVMWINSFIGTYDIQIIIDAKDAFQLDTITKELFNTSQNKINNFIILTHIADHRFSLLITDVKLNTKIELKNDSSFSASSFKDNIAVSETFNKEKISILDANILQALSNNPKATLIELANELQSNRLTIKSRIQKLIDKKIILAFSSVINTQPQGIIVYYMLVRLKQNTPKEKIKETFEKLNNDIFYAGQMSGNYDMILYLNAKNPHDLNESIDVFRKSLEEHILHYDLLVQDKVHHWKQYTQGVHKTILEQTHSK